MALTGDGGDELFAGYDRYRAVRLAAILDRLPGPIERFFGSRLWQRLPGRGRSLLGKFKRFSAALNRPLGRRYLDWIGIFDEPSRASLYTDDFLARLPGIDPAEFVLRAWRRAAQRDPVTAASLADLVTYLPCDLLCKVDIASMAHGLECRQPFLDHRVVELAAAAPVRWKQRWGKGKRILHAAFGDLIPASVRKRRKMGFAVPLENWLRYDLRDFVREVLLDNRSLNRGYFRPEEVRRLVDEHQSGAKNNSYRLWSLLIFELWHQSWLDGELPLAAIHPESRYSTSSATG